MTNEMTLNTLAARPAIFPDFIGRMAALATSAIGHAVAPASRYYSHVLQRSVNPRQTLHLLNAQVAFAMTVLPADGPLLLRCLCLAWLVAALAGCKAAMAGGEA